VHRIDDHARESFSTEHASRRAFLKGVGLAGVADLAAPLLVSRNAGADPIPPGLIYGINDENYLDFLDDNPAGFQYSYRAYKDTVWESVADVPLGWVADQPTNWVNWSVRPDLDLLLAGEFHDSIINLLATAPDHAQLTMWHEAADPPHCGPGNAYAVHAPTSIGGTATDGTWMTPENLILAHGYMQGLCSKYPNSNGNRVKYGQIFIGPANQGQVGGWIAGSLDWYGIDIYDGPIYWEQPVPNNDDTKSILNQSAIEQRMTGNKAFLDRIATGYQLHITETNAHVIQHRKNWALYLSQWMFFNGGSRFQWRYGGECTMSGAYADLEPSTRDYIAGTIIPDYGLPTYPRCMVRANSSGGTHKFVE
jgi:hypothetical protein